MIAAHLVKLACELPDKAGRSLSLWTCAELARTAIERGVVESISPQSVQRILQSQKLKPWRVHHWLSPKVEMDEAFRAAVLEVMDLYISTAEYSGSQVSDHRRPWIEGRGRDRDRDRLRDRGRARERERRRERDRRRGR